MRCPFCHCLNTQVKDSRSSDDDGVIRRRRECNDCNARFTTLETVQFKPLLVIKKSGKRSQFDRNKLEQSIYRALHKRGLENKDVELLINDVVQRIEKMGDLEIESKRIGDVVMEVLLETDPVAYIRFASVYHDFHTVDDFIDFIKKLKQ